MPAPIAPTLWSALDRARAAAERAPHEEPSPLVRLRLLPAEAPPARTPLEALLRFLERRPEALVLASSGPRLRHAHLLPEIAGALSTHAEHALLWAKLRRTPAAAIVARLAHPDWSATTRLHALWFVGAFVPPPAPWPIDGVRRVRDTARYRASVAERLAAGPSVAPGLADELALLFERYAVQAASRATSRSAPGSAAAGRAA